MLSKSLVSNQPLATIPQIYSINMKILLHC